MAIKMKNVISLRYGNSCSNAFLFYLLVCLIVTVIINLIFDFCMLFSAIDFIPWLFLCWLAPALFLAIFIPTLIKNKNAKSWLSDALIVNLDAMCEKIDNDLFLGLPNNVLYANKKSWIAVKFKYNNKKIVKYSGDKKPTDKNNLWFNSGFFSCFNKYVNKQIKIFYSPSYDEVFIVRQNH